MLAPFIRELRTIHPDHTITLLCLNGLAGLARLFPVDHVISAERPNLESRNLILQTAPKGFDNCYVFFSGAWLATLATIPIKSIISYPDPKGRRNHLIDKFIEFPSKITPFQELAMNALPKTTLPNTPPLDSWSPNPGTAILHLGARNPARQLNIDQIYSVINALNVRGITSIWLTGDSIDGIPFNTIMHHLNNHTPHLFDVRGKQSLNDLQKLIRHSQLLVCVDTGIAHLSKALGTPTLVLLGQSQSILFGMDNHYSRSRHVAVNDLPCRNKNTLHGIKADWIMTCNVKACPFKSRPCLPSKLPLKFYTQLDALLNDTKQDP